MLSKCVVWEWRKLKFFFIRDSKFTGQTGIMSDLFTVVLTSLKVGVGQLTDDRIHWCGVVNSGKKWGVFFTEKWQKGMNLSVGVWI